MQKLTGYMAGINLGGWLSQYDHKLCDNPLHHFDTFITKEDIALIASYGMDHIRLPFDYPLLENDAKPYVYDDAGFAYLDRCLAWCKEYGLNLVLDLHKAPGFSFGTPDKNKLFTDAEMQKRFIAMWCAIAEHFKGEGQNVVYELLNEIVEPDCSRWNSLATRSIEAIRKVDTEHYIIVGGIDYNSVWRLCEMPMFADDKIIYNFHMYEPFALTHQHAPWTVLKDYATSCRYPSDLAPYMDAMDFMSEGKQRILYDHGIYNELEKTGRMDRRYIDLFLQPAKDFIAKTGKPLYCGEYGVIERADAESRAAWTEDMAAFCIENGIGRAIWSYKQMDFTMIDEDRKPISDRLFKAAAMK